MAKTRIKHLKERRFWRWVMCEVYQKPGAIEWYRKHPIARKRRVQTRWRFNRRKADRAFQKVWKMIEEHRAGRPAREGAV